MTALREAREIGGWFDPSKPNMDSVTPELIRAIIVVATFIGLFVIWAGSAPLGSGIVSNGVIVVSDNRKAVQHQYGGVVDAIRVRENQTVEEGAILIELDSSQLESEIEILQSKLIELQAREARLEAQIEGARRVERPTAWSELDPAFQDLADNAFQAQVTELRATSTSIDAQIRVLQGSKAQLKARIEGYMSEMISVQEQLDVTTAEISKFRNLVERGLAPEKQLNDLLRAQLGFTGRLSTINAARIESNSALASVDDEITALQAVSNQENVSSLSGVREEILEISPQLVAQRTRLAQTKLRAPSSGVVVNLKAFTVGGVVLANDVVMEIVPVDRPLLIEANISPKFADNVYEGQDVQVRFSAFSGLNVPLLDGEVIGLSADRVTDLETDQPVFKTQVQLKENEVQRLVEAIEIDAGDVRPGLPVEVLIKMRDRTALDYLLSPVRDSLWRNFREE
ncbi:MAG: HlyD family type I secretion periplasmic adaptor subunit [Pseudomonadota bacterium]